MPIANTPIYPNTSFRYALIMSELDLDDQLAPLPDYSPDGVDLSLIPLVRQSDTGRAPRILEDRIAEVLRIRALNAGE